MKRVNREARSQVGKRAHKIMLCEEMYNVGSSVSRSPTEKKSGNKKPEPNEKDNARQPQDNAPQPQENQKEGGLFSSMLG
jgi:hypothetical protein